MRIAQVCTASGPIRPDNTGSVESLVWLLSRELAAMGHEVTLFGCAGSEAPANCEMVETLPGPYGCDGSPGDWQVCEWITLARAMGRSGDFDVLHSHAYLWGLPLDAVSKAPMVHTMHTCPYEEEALLWDLCPDAFITAISDSQWRGVGARVPAAVVHHGVDSERFTASKNAGKYLAYLGRFIPGKGPLEAIAAAKSLGMPIVLAGPRGDYFNDHVLPLVDGTGVRYAGTLDSRQRDAFLGLAAALVYPLRDPEPFGLVQVEAMMCGTPVAAIAIGAVTEIIDEGVTGRSAANLGELPGAILGCLKLDRGEVRRRAEQRFGARTMAINYEFVYRRRLGIVGTQD